MVSPYVAPAALLDDIRDGEFGRSTWVREGDIYVLERCSSQGIRDVFALDPVLDTTRMAEERLVIPYHRPRNIMTPEDAEWPTYANALINAARGVESSGLRASVRTFFIACKGMPYMLEAEPIEGVPRIVNSESVSFVRPGITIIQSCGPQDGGIDRIVAEK